MSRFTNKGTSQSILLMLQVEMDAIYICGYIAWILGYYLQLKISCFILAVSYELLENIEVNIFTQKS